MLNARQYRFVIEYCVDENASRAAVCAGYSESTAGQAGYALLKKSEILAAIESHQKDLSEAARLTAGLVTKNILRVMERGRPCNCRHCWGIDHGYQWTEREYERDLNAALKASAAAPDFSGGFGFIKRREPNEDCPNCKGEGLQLELPAKNADLLKAADLLQKQLGMQISRSEVSGPGGGPIQVDPSIPAAQLPADILDAMALEIMRKRGMIEGTLSEPDANGIRVSQLEAGSHP